MSSGVCGTTCSDCCMEADWTEARGEASIPLELVDMDKGGGEHLEEADGVEIYLEARLLC